MGGTRLKAAFEINLVKDMIKEEIGDSFVEHPIPRVISFTGSTTVGRYIGQLAMKNFKKPLLELGGNSAMMILEDADLEYAVNAAVFSRFTHQGQANRLSEMIAQAIKQGAQAVLHGKVSGTMVEPTVLTKIKPDMDVFQEELFGPVVSVIPFATEEEAVALANHSRYGLSGAIHTGHVERGVQLAKKIDTGMIHVNDIMINDESIVAFGGEKQSGIGRLNGQWSLEEFTTLKWVSVNFGKRTFPY
ncbi:hypothetical protein GCM10010965_20890 [Caldalkalibacillus thermarum]|nr:hypothetical protein GCM10010965_20890 [Caldalkalibacillus thermarum]